MSTSHKGKKRVAWGQIALECLILAPVLKYIDLNYLGGNPYNPAYTDLGTTVSILFGLITGQYLFTDTLTRYEPYKEPRIIYKDLSTYHIYSKNSSLSLGEAITFLHSHNVKINNKSAHLYELVFSEKSFFLFHAESIIGIAKYMIDHPEIKSFDEIFVYNKRVKCDAQ